MENYNNLLIEQLKTMSLKEIKSELQNLLFFCKENNLNIINNSFLKGITNDAYVYNISIQATSLFEIINQIINQINFNDKTSLFNFNNYINNKNLYLTNSYFYDQNYDSFETYIILSEFYENEAKELLTKKSNNDISDLKNLIPEKETPDDILGISDKNNHSIYKGYVYLFGLINTNRILECQSEDEMEIKENEINPWLKKVSKIEWYK